MKLPSVPGHVHSDSLIVLQIGSHEYTLWLAPDSSTGSHTQWFYFAVRNGRCGIRYKFNIVNLRKDRSLYSQGMQPVVHSAKEAATKVGGPAFNLVCLGKGSCSQCRAAWSAWRISGLLQGRGWFRAGNQVSYQEGLPCDSSGRCYYTLSFTLTLPHNRDTVHIAHCFPYTYTDLTRWAGGSLWWLWLAGVLFKRQHRAAQAPQAGWRPARPCLATQQRPQICAAFAVSLAALKGGFLLRGVSCQPCVSEGPGPCTVAVLSSLLVSS